MKLELGKFQLLFRFYFRGCDIDISHYENIWPDLLFDRYFIFLLRKDMWNSFSALIIVLTVVDTFLCVLLMSDYTFARAFQMHTVIYTIFYPPFIYPMVNIMLSASIYLTVVLAIER